MRDVWRGTLSFGLVNIPIRLYSALEPQGKGFTLLHKQDKIPIKYKRWCPKHKKEIEWDDIAKGIEIKKNRYYVIEKEELQALKPKRTDIIEILEIINSRQVDPIYFESHYYVGPEREKEKPYFLFRHVLQDSAKAAIGRFVMRDKEHVCLIESYSSGLLLTTLTYAHGVRDINKVDFLASAPQLQPREISLARQLIEKLEKPEFDMKQYRDTFMDELKALVMRKSKGEQIKASVEKKKDKQEKNLIVALKESLK